VDVPRDQQELAYSVSPPPPILHDVTKPSDAAAAGEVWNQNSKRVERIILVTVAVLLAGLLVMNLIRYSPAGDLQNVMGRRAMAETPGTEGSFGPPTEDVRDEFNGRKYSTVDQIMKRMHELIQYRTASVRWPYYLALAMVTATVILSVLRSLTVRNFFIVTFICFLAIDLPIRHERAHYGSVSTMEGDALFGMYRGMTARTSVQ
jgi:hypothetical protein